jgi:outer membrane protein OmpA-like peptidoglycan-associated protein
MTPKTASVLVPAFAVAGLALASVAGPAAMAASDTSADEIVSSDEILRQLVPPEAKPLSSRKPKTRGIGVEPTPAAVESASPEAGAGFRRVALPAIEFEFDSDRLTGAAERQLAELARALTAPALRGNVLSIQGHTDSTGSDAYNRALSLRRARAVKGHLVAERGLSPARLVEAGLGEAFPLPGLAGEDGRNRRVEIVHLGIEMPPGGSGAGREAPAARPLARRALLIGIGRYRHVSPLEGPVNDVRAMSVFLTGSLGYRSRDIKTLVDAEATRRNILDAIERWLVAGTAPGDEAFLFFSGHGFQQPDTNGDEADQRDETLVPVDAFVDDRRTVVGMIADDEIAALLDRMRGRRIHVVLDSCHSGTGTRGIGDWRHVKSPRLPDGTPLRVAAGRTRGVGGTGPVSREAFLSADRPELTVWTAVRAEQKALVDVEAVGAPGSVFTRLFLRGADDKEADRNADGTVTAQELHDYLVAGSEAYCRRHPDHCGAGLTPQLFAAPSRLGEPALAGTDASVGVAFRPAEADVRAPWVARLAKDILVRETDAADGGRDLRLRMNPGPSIPVGAALDIVVESDRDGHLLVLDVDAKGRLVQIFPNTWSLAGGVSDRIRVGQRVVLPGERAGFRFRAEPPLGRGALIAVVSEESVPLRSLAARHKDLSVVPHPESYLVELAEVLRDEDANGGNANRTGWTVTKLDYEIVQE